MNNVSFDSAKPMYMQIKDRIKEQILSGEFKKGEKIPSERELCQMFGVSRITARQAISEAINEGLLFTVQGKGTFVCKRNDYKIDQGLIRVTSFESTLTSKGLSAGTRILGHKIQPVDFALCRILNLRITDHVLNLNLLGTADGQPIVLYKSYFAVDLGMEVYKQALEKEKDGIAFSTIDLYKNYLISPPQYIEQTFEAITAGGSLADTLETGKNHPLFLVSSIVYDSDDKPIEYRKAYYRADKYKFHIRRDI
jgi:GntR family transcriptional regulator